MSDAPETTAAGAAGVSAGGAAEAEVDGKATTPKPKYTIPRKLGANTPSPSKGNEDRASRDRGEAAGDHPTRSSELAPIQLDQVMAQTADGAAAATNHLASASQNPLSQGIGPPDAFQGQGFLGYQGIWPTSAQSGMHPHTHAGMLHPAPALPQMYPTPGTPFGYGGYPPSGGYPPQPAGPCTSTSTHAAPLLWRNDDADFERMAKEMAAATDRWKQLDDHSQLMDPTVKPPDSNGLSRISQEPRCLSPRQSPPARYSSDRKAPDAGTRSAKLSRSYSA